MRNRTIPGPEVDGRTLASLIKKLREGNPPPSVRAYLELVRIGAVDAATGQLK